MMTESEVWKDIKGFEGFYRVSNKGNVHSVERISSQNKKCGGIILNPRPTTQGYLQVILCKNGINKYKFTHRLVAEAFLPNPNNFPQVNHIDEIKDNNNVSNLEWCDARYNNNHGTRNERDARTKSKKVRAINVETGEVLTFNSTQEAGRKGYNQGVVSSASRGVYKTNNGALVGGDGRTYRGHKWSYE